MTDKVERKYSVKDADFLLTSATVVENAINEKEFLQKKRSTWKDPYFETVKERIDHAVQHHLGYDNAKELRKATQALASIQEDAVSKLSECKVQIKEDFKKNPSRREEILNQLGFNLYTNIAKHGDQQEVIGLLYQFKTNMSSDLKDEITALGTAPELIEDIVKYADFLLTANVIQETNKNDRKKHTVEMITELNDLYDDVIRICKISSNFYKGQPHMQELFSFSRIQKAISGKIASPAKAKKADQKAKTTPAKES